MTCSYTLFFFSVFGFSLLLGQSLGDDNLTIASENTTLSSVITTSISTELNSSPAITTESPANTNSTVSPYSHYTQSNTTVDVNITTDGQSFNSTNGTTISPLSSVTAMSESKADSTGGGQRFDAASFVGGIVLAVGVLGLGIFIFKVYQSRRSDYSNI